MSFFEFLKKNLEFKKKNEFEFFLEFVKVLFEFLIFFEFLEVFFGFLNFFGVS